MPDSFDEVISARLLDAGEEKTKAWWESYMKGVVPFYGVNLVDVRSIVKEEFSKHGHADLTTDERLAIGLKLFDGDFAEDKLAGILYLENYATDALDERVIGEFERLFEKELIFDWNVCDWFCVRVLAQVILLSRQAAITVSQWSKADYLWKARAGLVGFVNIVALNDDTYDFHRDLVLKNAPHLITREERFAKTSVGWTLGEMGKVWPEKVQGFVAEHEQSFSNEAKKRALKNISMR